MLLTRRINTADLGAGILSVINLSPIDVGYGLLLASALGFSHTGTGIAAALLAVIVGNFVPSLLARTGMLFGGARPAQTLLIAELATRLLGDGTPTTLAGLFAHLALCTLLAGSLQCLFGLARAGRLIKYFPVPVLTGYINAVALLIAGSALVVMLGFPRGTGYADMIRNASSETAWHAAFACLLLAAMAWGQKHGRTLHWSVLGLFGGSVLYHLGSAAGLPLGGTLPVGDGLLPPWQGTAALLTGQAGSAPMDMLRTVLPHALAIAVLNSMESLLAAARQEEYSGERSDPDRVLLGQGLANMAGGLLGALPLAPSISRLTLAWELGGRTRRALQAGALTGIVLMVFGNWCIGLVPTVVVGCLMAFLAWTMLDNWTHGQIRKAFSKHLEPSLRRQVRTNMKIMLVVLAVALSGHLIAAMLAGAAVAMFLFIRDHGRSVIGRSFSGAHRHSVVMRQEHEMDLLRRHGQAIRVQELDAPIVFGTADRLLDHLERLPDPIRFLILDFRHVGGIDDRGARILVRLAGQLAARGVELHLAGLHPEGPRGSVLVDAGMGRALPVMRWHADAESALEAAENRLLGENDVAAQPMNLRALDIVRGLEDHELTVLMHYLETDCYAAGQAVFSHGEAGDRLYIVAAGRVEIHLPLDTARGVKRRIAAFPPGVVFGEMAMLGGGERSADALAVGETAVWSLSRSALERLQADCPQLAARLMHNVARQLSARLAVTNDELAYATRT